MGNDLSLPYPAEMLVPHRPPLCLVKRLLEFSGQAGVVEAVIEQDNIFLNEDGSLPTLIAVELIAQASAAIKGYDDLTQGKQIKKGFLVDVREMHFSGVCFRSDRLLVKVEIIKTLSGFSVVHGNLMRGDEAIASGTIKLWVPDESNPPVL